LPSVDKVKINQTKIKVRLVRWGTHVWNESQTNILFD